MTFAFAHHRSHTPARILLMGLVIFSLALAPIGVQAIGLSDLTETATETSLPPSPSATRTVEPSQLPEISWLSPASAPADLATDRSLAFLAGRLIFSGLVDAGSCSDGGMLKNGSASPCGERVARNAVILWQNQFDEAIQQSAAQNGVPPYMLKNVITQESQFWPAQKQTFYGYYEYGLGHITQMGVDTLLRWNKAFYSEFCRTVYDQKTCRTDFAWLPAGQQAVLRGAAIQLLIADCGECAGGVSIQRSRASLPVIAASLKANYNHVEWLLRGLSRSTPNRVFEGSDMWRMTLASYNAGPGCLTTAVYRVNNLGQNFTWKNVSRQFDTGCEGAIEYVEKVTSFHPANPQNLALAQADTSRAARLVFQGLGITTPTPTFTAEALTVTPALETPTVTETPASPSETALTPESTPTGTFPAETATPEPTATFTSTPTVTPTAIPVETQASDSEIVIKFGPLVPEFIANGVIESAGAQITSRVDSLDLTIVQGPPDALAQLLQDLNSNWLVDYAEPNYNLSALYTPNDPGFQGQTSLLDLHVPQAWDITQGQGVIVAVIDTGVDTSHPDLAGAFWTNPGETGSDASGNDKRTNGLDDDGDGYIDDWRGWNFVNRTSNLADNHGHGTHSTGIIAARMDNSEGIAGIAPQAKIMPLKALADDGSGTYADVAEAIYYAVDHGAKVINLGFGGTANSQTLLNATDYAYANGVTVIAAAGNSSTDTTYYPAANPNVIAVSALNPFLNIASYSSFGPAVDLSAPGSGIFSALPGSLYGSMSGTSMSAAEISGVAALLASMPQFNTPDKVSAALFNTATDLGQPGQDLNFGFGLANALDAVNSVPGSLPTSAWVTGTPNPNATGGVIVQALEQLPGDSQTCSGSGVTPSANAANAVGIPNTTWGSCAGQYEKNPTPGSWVFTIQNPTFPANAVVGPVNLVIAYSVTWNSGTGDTMALQVSNNNGATWNSVASFTANVARTTQTLNVSTWFTTSTQVTNAQVRFVVSPASNPSDNITVEVDGLYLDANHNTPTPAPPTATFTPTNTPTATNTPIPPTFTPTNTPGGPTPTFTPTTVAGVSPHGNYNGTTDQCALCHRTHSGRSLDGMLLTSTTNTSTTNDFCLSCHSSGAVTVSTHSNIHKTGTQETFELLCIQCHDPHGSANLSTIRPMVRVQQNPSIITTGPVVFTARTGENSFDELPADASSADDICVTCHVNSNRPGAGTNLLHPGGALHQGNVDYRGQNCITCHPHSADNSAATKDGFMPSGGSCLGCHATAQDNNDGKPVGGRRAIVSASGDFVRTSHHVTNGTTTQVVKDSDCIICHDQSQHMSGFVRLNDVDNPVPASAFALDGINESVKYENFCLKCHDTGAKPGANGDTTPFSDNTAVVVVDATAWGSASHTTAVSTFGGSCRDCHSNGHGSNKVNLLSAQSLTNNWSYINDGNADDPMQQEERFCFICHKSGGSSSKDIFSAFNNSARWVSVGVNNTNNLNLNDRHDVQLSTQSRSGAKIECTSCHNPHTDSPTQKVIADPDPGNTPPAMTGASAMTLWCLDCHDGTYPTGVTAPTKALINIGTTYSTDTHGAGSGAVKTLRGGTGYTTSVTVQCTACHATHLPSTTNNNYFQLVDILRNPSTGVALPSDGSPYSFIDNSGTFNLNTDGYNWCNTCHTGSMGNDAAHTNCSNCHFHSTRW
jgi:subtilisin family serine protease